MRKKKTKTVSVAEAQAQHVEKWQQFCLLGVTGVFEAPWTWSKDGLHLLAKNGEPVLSLDRPCRSALLANLIALSPEITIMVMRLLGEARRGDVLDVTARQADRLLAQIAPLSPSVDV